MRISDWSQTCALPISAGGCSGGAGAAIETAPGDAPSEDLAGCQPGADGAAPGDTPRRARRALVPLLQRLEPHGLAGTGGAGPRQRAVRGTGRGRSEEHTSELQSLMRHSYAVFCLKKQKQTES